MPEVSTESLFSIGLVGVLADRSSWKMLLFGRPFREKTVRVGKPGFSVKLLLNELGRTAIRRCKICYLCGELLNDFAALSSGSHVRRLLQRELLPDCFVHRSSDAVAVL